MRAPPRNLVPGLLLAIALVWPQPVGAQLYEVEGLRLTMSIREVELVVPLLTVEQVPYVDDRVGTEYDVILGRVEPLRFEGRALIERSDRDKFELVVIFTGQPELFAVQAQILRPGTNCLSAIEGLENRYGRPILDDRPGYAAWRQVVVLGPELEFRCLDDRNGLFVVTLEQPYLQELYVEDLRRRLEPTIEATLQFLQ